MDVEAVDNPPGAGDSQGDRWLGGLEGAFASRGRRVLAALIVVWLLSVFDLVFTILAHRIGGFRELNPIAARLLRQSGWLALFKFATVATGSGILLLFRRRLISEIAAWLVCAIYVVLAWMWIHYYELPTWL